MSAPTNNKVANNPSAAGSALTAAELARADSARIDAKLSIPESGVTADGATTRRQEQRRAAADAQRFDEGLRQSMLDLQKLTRKSDATDDAKWQEAKKRQAEQSAAQTTQQQSLAQSTPKISAAPLTTGQAAPKPTTNAANANSAQSNAKQGGEQPFAQRDPQDRNTSTFSTGTGLAKSLPATLKQMAVGRMAPLVAPKLPNAPKNTAAPMTAKAMPETGERVVANGAKEPHQLPETEQQVARATASRMQGALVGNRKEEKTAGKEKSGKKDESDEVADSGAKNGTAGAASGDTDKRVGRKGGQGGQQGMDRSLSGSLGTIDHDDETDAVAATGRVAVFGAESVGNHWQVQKSLDAKKDYAAVLKSPYAVVESSMSEINLVRGGLAGRMIGDAPGDVSQLLYANLLNANVRGA